MTATEINLLKKSLSWLVLLLLSLFFQSEIGGLLSILIFLWWLALLIAGIVLVIRSVSLLFTQPRKVAPAVSLLIPLLAAGFVWMGGGFWLFTVRARLKADHYEPMVAQFRGYREKGREYIGGQECMINPGPPLRVAFVQPGGFSDNYWAIVYDPTGMVMKAEATWEAQHFSNDPNLPSTLGLFEEPMIGAVHLKGPWYLCRFT
ncbi:MAG: hypothetical protein KY468_17285 [Armatimonadetes bacterium]|nr:hypothetical protein [Armatimonadota bacterium]